MTPDPILLSFGTLSPSSSLASLNAEQMIDHPARGRHVYIREGSGDCLSVSAEF